MRWLCFVLLFPALAFAGEDCSLLGGTCREVCAAYEEAEKGAFLDCSDKQECCVKKESLTSGDKKIRIEGKDSDQKSKTEK
jgi:hypothetical protein